MQDRETLVALYNGTGGANWHSNGNWLTEKPLGQWHGVTTDHVGRVKRLSLEENNLAGAIPPELLCAFISDTIPTCYSAYYYQCIT